MLNVLGTGVATYAQGLRRAQASIGDGSAILVASGTAHPIVRFLTASVKGTVQAKVLPALDGAQRFAVCDLYRHAHVHFSIHRRLLQVRLPDARGIMHWTYPVPLFVEGWTNIYTVHDVIPLEYPELSAVRAKRLHATLREISAVAARIVTVTQAAQSAIAGCGLFDPARIVDCGQVVAPGDVPPGRLPPGLLPGKYLLFCGSIEPRKNLERLLAAHKLSGCRLPLVIAGPDGWKAEPILAGIAEAPGAIRIPYLPREDMVRLIAHARALLFPSITEGFGLPLVEAMALGVPTLASDIPAHREVSGGASLLVDPLSVEAIAGGISRLVGDDRYAGLLAVRGRSNAGRYSLENFAKRLSNLYQAAFAEGSTSA